MSLDVLGSAQGAYQSIRPQQGQSQAGTGSAAEAAAVMQASKPQAVTQISVVGASGESGAGYEEGHQPSDKDVQSAIDMANKRARFHNTNAQFAYHEDTKRISIKIIDNETQEVIKEIPSEETLEMIGKLYDLLGMVVDEKR